MFKTFKANLQHIQKRMVFMDNKKRSEITFNWEIMFISSYNPIVRLLWHTEPLRNQLQNITSHTWFNLEKIGTLTYRIDLPSSVAIHPVFHVSQLKKRLGNKMATSLLPCFSKQTPLQPQAIMECRMMKSGNQAATQIIIHWKN